MHKLVIHSIALSVLLGMLPAASAKQAWVYFGTYTGPQSKGIYAAKLDDSSGKLDAPFLAGELTSPSFLTIHPNRKYLYAVTEAKNSTVTAFAIDAKTGMLTLLNTVATKGSSGCHLVVDRTGKSLVLDNYGNGSVVTFRVGADGRLSEVAANIQHSGSGPDSKRQRGPHAHGVTLSPDNRFVFVPDLGVDKIVAYRLDPEPASLTAHDPPFATVPEGSGPRHFAFHPKQSFSYSVNEMKSSVTVFSYDREKGALTSLQTVANLPEDFKGVNNSAEIDIDADGKFLYASNRGHDSITVYAIDAERGTLTTVERVLTQGKTPRGFKIDASGHYLIAANQDSNSVVVFKRDGGTGRLTPTGQTISVGAPVCVIVLPIN